MLPAWNLFLAMGTQWSAAGMAGLRLGLKYEVLPLVAGLQSPPVELDSRVFADIRLMESTALEVWSQRRR